jgi:LPXTG-motif cell wall-anchored protein
MRKTLMPFALFLIALTVAGSATAADRAILEQKLTAKYRLSTVNAEGDFVLKGSTLVLKKGGFTGGADPLTCIHQYSDGKISLTGPSKAACTGAVRTLSKIPGFKLIPGVGAANQTAQGASPATRPFVAGEKLYMTKIEVVKDDINLTLISEQVNSMRYRAEIRFHKAAKLEVLEAESLIAEVLGIGAGGGSGGGTPTASRQPASTPAAPAQPDATPSPASPPAATPVDTTAVAAPQAATPDSPPAPIAPPPPPEQPVAPPPTISTGMTIDQVVAQLGQPTRVVDLGSKKIYAYPNQKVTFVNGKVSLDDGDDSSAPATGSSNVLPYEIGIGILILGAAGFLFMRSRRPAAVVSGPQPPMALAAAASQQQAPPPPRSAASASPTNLIERLEELERLKERGILTQAEFDREKAKLRAL